MADCPECKTILPSGANRCPCGWRDKPKPQMRNKRCPGCGQSIHLQANIHGCGWMTWNERLIQDAMQTNPRDAVERVKKAYKLERGAS